MIKSHHMELLPERHRSPREGTMESSAMGCLGLQIKVHRQCDQSHKRSKLETLGRPKTGPNTEIHISSNPSRCLAQLCGRVPECEVEQTTNKTPLLTYAVILPRKQSMPECESVDISKLLIVVFYWFCVRNSRALMLVFTRQCIIQHIYSIIQECAGTSAIARGRHPFIKDLFSENGLACCSSWRSAV